MTLYYFVRPTDSLFVRGNLAFGQSGEHGTGVMPPPPSLFAGAFRSAILGGDAKALEQFTQQGRCDDAGLHAALGSVDKPGAFRIAWLSLAGALTPNPSPGGRGENVEAILPLPADLVRLESEFVQVTPGKPNPLIEDGRELPRVAVMRSGKQEKAQGGYYLRQSGWLKYLQGEIPDTDNDSAKATQVHARDPRLGIGLNPDARTAESGLIYTTEGHAFSPSIQRGDGEGERIFAETGFLVGIDGADDLLPELGFLRLGGDGRGAEYRRVDFAPPAPPLEEIRQARRFRLILSTPGLFEQGWLPPGLRSKDGVWWLEGGDFSARLAAAAVPRHEVVSGWDLANWRPKAAQRAAPAGSVYWFDECSGDLQGLGKLAEQGLWALGAYPDAQRRAEGFNNVLIAAWPQEEQ